MLHKGSKINKEHKYSGTKYQGRSLVKVRFKGDLKDIRETADLISLSRLFQSLGALEVVHEGEMLHVVVRTS